MVNSVMKCLLEDSCCDALTAMKMSAADVYFFLKMEKRLNWVSGRLSILGSH